MARRPRLPRRELSLPQILPNLMTVGAICAGLTAIRFAIHDRFEAAVILIVIAAALDGLDGRLARMLKSESALGAELDSLADFLNFGVAPGLIMYLWALQDARSAGWIMVMIYTICCVLRLARFNVGNKSHIDVMAGPMAEPLSDDKRFFIGVPSPAGAFLVMLPLFVGRLFPEMMQPHALLIGGYMVLIGLLMISRLPTFSFKATKIYAEYARFMVIALVAGVAALFTWPWATLVGLDLAYFGVLIWSWIAFRARVRATPPS